MENPLRCPVCGTDPRSFGGKNDDMLELVDACESLMGKSKNTESSEMESHILALENQLIEAREKNEQQKSLIAHKDSAIRSLIRKLSSAQTFCLSVIQRLNPVDWPFVFSQCRGGEFQVEQMRQNVSDLMLISNIDDEEETQSLSPTISSSLVEDKL